MSDEINIVETGFKTLVGVALATGGWLWSRLVSAVVKNRDDLADHKLYVAENYIKTDAIDRIYERINDVSQKQDRMLEILLGKHK